MKKLRSQSKCFKNWQIIKYPLKNLYRIGPRGLFMACQWPTASVSLEWGWPFHRIPETSCSSSEFGTKNQFPDPIWCRGRSGIWRRNPKLRGWEQVRRSIVTSSSLHRSFRLNCFPDFPRPTTNQRPKNEVKNIIWVFIFPWLHFDESQIIICRDHCLIFFFKHFTST